MWDRVISNVLVLVFIMILLFFLSPRQDVVQLHAPDDYADRREYIWVWDEHWAGSATIQVNPGRAVAWGLGWGSADRGKLEDLLDGLEMSFYIDDREIRDPKKYFAFRDFMQRGDRFWTLVFHYEHSPLSPGEYTWHMQLGGSVRSREISGMLIVRP